MLSLSCWMIFFPSFLFCEPRASCMLRKHFTPALETFKHCLFMQITMTSVKMAENSEPWWRGGLLVLVQWIPERRWLGVWARGGLWLTGAAVEVHFGAPGVKQLFRKSSFYSPREVTGPCKPVRALEVQWTSCLSLTPTRTDLLNFNVKRKLGVTGCDQPTNIQARLAFSFILGNEPGVFALNYILSHLNIFILR